jgi:membrane fusion protein, multidrug efflux system
MELKMAGFDFGKSTHRPVERWTSLGIVAGAVLLGLAALWRANYHPRTDDAEIFANLIGIAPQVEGPIVELPVRDNQFVRKGDLLFVIDPRPYQYALEKATAAQTALEGEIEDEERRIAAEVSGVSVAAAEIKTAEAEMDHWAAAVDQAHADVTSAEQGIGRTKAEWTYANDNLHRLEPLLQKQFVTVDDVDRARTSEEAEDQALRQAESQLLASQAELKSTEAQYLQAKAQLEERQAGHQQARHSVLTLEPLIDQRGERQAEVKDARYNLDNCRVYAPFDARVTNLTISEGEYAHVGQQVFTLIDARIWWAVANFREGQIRHIRPGMRANIYLMSRPDERFTGVVDSIGFGVTPDPDVVGKLSQGLPDVQRTLNWVHLAARYPVRVRVTNSPPDVLRIGQTAVVTIRGN